MSTTQPIDGRKKKRLKGKETFGFPKKPLAGVSSRYLHYEDDQILPAAKGFSASFLFPLSCFLKGYV
jgi:hypothetical protein